MPDPHDNAKMTGDLHPPEVESELPLEEQGGSSDVPGVSGTAQGRGTSSEQGRPGRGSKKAGLLKERDDTASDGQGTTRESGEDTIGRRE